MTDTMLNLRSCMGCDKPLPDHPDGWMVGECESPTCGATHYICPDCVRKAEDASLTDDEPTPEPAPN